MSSYIVKRIVEHISDISYFINNSSEKRRRQLLESFTRNKCIVRPGRDGILILCYNCYFGDTHRCGFNKFALELSTCNLADALLNAIEMRERLLNLLRGLNKNDKIIL